MARPTPTLLMAFSPPFRYPAPCTSNWHNHAQLTGTRDDHQVRHARRRWIDGLTSPSQNDRVVHVLSRQRYFAHSSYLAAGAARVPAPVEAVGWQVRAELTCPYQTGIRLGEVEELVATDPAASHLSAPAWCELRSWRPLSSLSSWARLTIYIRLLPSRRKTVRPAHRSSPHPTGARSVR
jgi:hypothetical protein